MAESVPGFVTYKEAMARLGILKRQTLYERLDVEGVPRFQHPHDRKFRLIREEDMQRLLTPREVSSAGVAS